MTHTKGIQIQQSPELLDELSNDKEVLNVFVTQAFENLREKAELLEALKGLIESIEKTEKLHPECSRSFNMAKFIMTGNQAIKKAEG